MYEILGDSVNQYYALSALLAELNAMQSATAGGAAASMQVDTVNGSVPLPGNAVSTVLATQVTRATNQLARLTTKLDAAAAALA